MPELPEVETIKNNFQDILPAQIRDLEICRPDIVRAGEFTQNQARGQTIAAVSRRGKYLVIELENHLFLVFHLGMSGRLYQQKNDIEISEPHVHVIIHLDQPLRLLYQDARRFGGLWMLKEVETLFGRLGQEPLEPGFSALYLYEVLQGRKTSIKNVLLDQRWVAGLGNIYVDESLFAAGIRPDRPAGGISRTEAEKLVEAIQEVLRKSIRYRGTTFRDFRDGYRQRGDFQNHLRVYGRYGQPCRYCETPIERIRIAGRGTHYCPRCQS